MMPGFTDAAEALKAVAGRADPKRLAGVNAVVLFDLAGEGGGQWTATIKDGQFDLVEGAKSPSNVTFKMKAADFTGIVNGTLNPVAAFMQGRVRVEGDMSVAMQLQTLFT
jgi:putative sterol carrier protein